MREDRHIVSSALCVAVAAAAFIMSFATKDKARADYTTQQIFETSRDDAPGYSRQPIDFGDPRFAFTSLVSDEMVVRVTDAGKDSGEPVVVIENRDEADRFAIEIFTIDFPAFAEAQVAGYGFLRKRGYNRVIQDKDKSNMAAGHMAGAILDEESGEYSRMTRLATVSRGKVVLFIYATFAHEHYLRHQDALARFLGSLEMDEPGAPMETLREIEASAGERFLVPADWTVVEAETQPESRSDFDLSLNDNEYPNLFVTIRPVPLEEGRQLGIGIIEALNAQVEASPLAEFVGEAEMSTIRSESGEDTGYSYARGAVTVDGAHLLSEFHIQTNHDVESISIIGLNSFDVRRGIEAFDEEAQDIIFKGWVVGTSASAVARLSLGGTEYVEEKLDIRSLAH